MKNSALISKTLKSQQGLTLTEILISLTIIGFIATFIGGKIFEQLHEGRVEASKIQMQNLAARLKEFRRHCGRYPTTDQGLDALVEKPTGGTECKRYSPGGYIEEGKVPLDPWGNPYDYVSDGSNFNIISHGQDGLQGGEDKDADIYLFPPEENGMTPGGE